MGKNRRKTVLVQDALFKLWDSVGAEICTNFSENIQSRTEYTINSHVNFEQVADNIHVILQSLLQTLEKSFPTIFATTPINIRYKPSRRTSAPTRTERSSRSNRTKSPVRGRRSSTRSQRGFRSQTSPTPTGKWTCMGYSKEVDEWKKEPITTANPQMKALIDNLKMCLAESEEKFMVMPLTWSLTTKWNTTSSHYSCMVVDLSPHRTAQCTEMHVILIDVNGYGNSSSAYKHVFKEPSMGLNPLIQLMITSLFTYVKKQLGYCNVRVSFPAFSGINVREKSALNAQKKDVALFPHVKLINTKMESGVCSIATIFVIIRLACDQRKVFKEGIDATLKRFTKSTEGGITEYKHILFVRAFTYSFMKFLGMDLPRFGIKGEPCSISVTEKGFTTVQGDK
jgi:hypothetical protein